MGGSVAKEIIVERGLAAQGVEIGGQGYYRHAEHVAHEYAHDGDEIAGVEGIGKAENDEEEKQSHEHRGSEEAACHGKEGCLPSQMCAAYGCGRRHHYHHCHPCNVDPGIVPCEEILEVDADERHLHYHPRQGDEWAADEVGLKPVECVEWCRHE